MASAWEYFHGHCFSVRGYDSRFRANDRSGIRLPSSETICDHAPGENPAGPWEEMRELGAAHVLGNPRKFPNAYAVLSAEART